MLRRAGVLAGVVVVLLCCALAPAASSYVYWVNASITLPTSYTIGRATLEGNHASPRFISGLAPQPGAHITSVVATGSGLYWMWFAYEASGQGEVYGIGRANLDGSGVNPEIVSWTTGAYGGYELATDGHYLYFTGPFTSLGSCGMTPCGAIGRANLDGTGLDLGFATENFSEVREPSGAITVVPPYIYWVSGARIVRTPIGSSNAEPFVAGVGGGHHTQTLASDGRHLLWDRSTSCEPAPPPPSQIARIDLDGSALNTSLIPNAEPCEGVFLAADSAHIYWDAFQHDEIMRADSNGAGARPLVHAVFPQALAVDALGPAGRAAKKCVVPDLRGLTVSSARSVLRAHGCSLGVLQRVTAPKAKRGRIVRQSPRRGQRLAPSSRVRISVGS